MRITDFEITPVVPDRATGRLLAHASIVIDDAIVVHDIRIIRGDRGLFVAMPSVKVTDKCPRCHARNHVVARYCNDCGGRLDPERAAIGEDGKPRIYADVLHPLNTRVRRWLEREVIAAYRREIDLMREDDETEAAQRGAMESAGRGPLSSRLAMPTPVHAA